MLRHVAYVLYELVFIPTHTVPAVSIMRAHEINRVITDS